MIKILIMNQIILETFDNINCVFMDVKYILLKRNFRKQMIAI
jgi:hypothetical protein